MKIKKKSIQIQWTLRLLKNLTYINYILTVHSIYVYTIILVH